MSAFLALVRKDLLLYRSDRRAMIMNLLLPIVLGEVQALYRAACAGRPLELAPVRPYSDYLAWLRQQVRPSVIRALRAVDLESILDALGLSEQVRGRTKLRP
mgnify:CR=1 FL=1